MDLKRLCIILLLVHIATCTLSKSEKKKKSSKTEEENKSEVELDKEAMMNLVSTMQQAGELNEEEVATFVSIMDKMKGNLEIFTAKHAEVDALKEKFQTQIKGLETLHSEMRETQEKMALEQELMGQQQAQFNQVQEELLACKDDLDSSEIETTGLEKEVSRLTKDLKEANGQHQDEKKNRETCQKGLVELESQNAQLKEKLASGNVIKETPSVQEAFEEERKELVDKIIHLQAQLDKKDEGLDLSRDVVIKRKDERIAFFQEEKLRLVDGHREREKKSNARLNELQQKLEEMSRSGPLAGYIEELQENVKHLEGKLSSLQAEAAHVKEQYSESKMINTDLSKSVSQWTVKHVGCMRNNTKLEKELEDFKDTNKDLEEAIKANKEELASLRKENKNALSIRDVSMTRLKEIDRQCKKDIKSLNGDLEKCSSNLAETATKLQSCEDAGQCKVDPDENEIKELRQKIRTMKFTMDRSEKKQERDATMLEEIKASLKTQSTENSICGMRLDTTSKSLAQKDAAIKDLSKKCVQLGECELDKNDLQTLYDKALKDCHCKPVEEVGEEGETVINRFELTEVGNQDQNEELQKEVQRLEEEKQEIKAKLSAQYKLTDELRESSNEVRERIIKCSGDVETLTVQQKTLLEDKAKCQKEMEKVKADRKDETETTNTLDLQDDLTNCQETLALIRAKQKTCSGDLETLRTDHSDMLTECEDLYNDYQKCDGEKQSLAMKAGGVDMIVQKMEEGHQAKLGNAEQKLQEAIRSEMELFWVLLVTVILCIIFGYYSCHSYFKNKYSTDESASTKKKSKDSKKRR